MRVRAKDHSGNPTNPSLGWTSRFGLSTGAVGRLDAVNNDFGRKWSAVSTSTQTLGSSVQVVAVTVTLLSGQTSFIDASWLVEFNGSVGPTATCGYEIQRNGTKINSGSLTATKVNSVVDIGVGSSTLSDSPGAGTFTYRIWVYGGLTGSVACSKTRAEITVSESRR